MPVFFVLSCKKINHRWKHYCAFSSAISDVVFLLYISFFNHKTVLKRQLFLYMPHRLNNVWKIKSLYFRKSKVNTNKAYLFPLLREILVHSDYKNVIGYWFFDSYIVFIMSIRQFLIIFSSLAQFNQYNMSSFLLFFFCFLRLIHIFIHKTNKTFFIIFCLSVLVLIDKANITHLLHIVSN